MASANAKMQLTENWGEMKRCCFFSPEETANALEPSEQQAGTGWDADLEHKLPAVHTFNWPGWCQVCFSSRAKLEMKVLGIFSVHGEGQEARVLWAFLYLSHSCQSGSGDAGFGLGLRFWKPFLKVDLLSPSYF